MTNTDDNTPPTPKADLTRRRALLAGGAVLAAGIGAAGAASAAPLAPGGASTSSAAAGTKAGAGAQDCYELSSELVEGPYYIDEEDIRSDIREDREGIPLTLRLTVTDSVSCAPLAGAAVDIWQCDALGVYSGFGSAAEAAPGASVKGTPTNDSRFLRGTQLTDDQGYVEFTTIFPGWYQGRAVHIHVKVNVDGEPTEGGYEGGHTCHTGQFFFEEAAVIEAAALDPYATSTTRRTTLDEDGIYDGSGATGGLLTLSYTEGQIGDGVIGTSVLGVDPDATNDGTGGGPGGPTA